MKLPTSPKRSEWRTAVQCPSCRTVDLDINTACPTCGSRDIRTSDFVSVRHVTYTWLHRVALFLARKPQPRNYWQIKKETAVERRIADNVVKITRY